MKSCTFRLFAPAKKLIILLFTAALVLLTLGGCEQKPPSTSAPSTRILLKDALTAKLTELPTGAIPVWRQHASQKPTLLLYSNDPLLQSTPPQLQSAIRELVSRGNEQQIRAAGPLAAETLLQPSQTLTAALDKELFSGVVWVTPNATGSERLADTEMAEALYRLGAIDDYERQSFEPTENGLKGEVYGTPFQIVYHDRLPALDTPVVLHIDLSFFTSVYENEIKTPLFKTLKGVIRSLQQMSYPTLAASLSYSNLNRWVPLDRRFIGPAIATMLDNPAILDQPIPEAWQRKSESLYLSTFFQNEQRAALFKPLIEANADRPADIYWELYTTTIKFSSFEEATGHLEQAVKRDPAYALAYLDLANRAMQKAMPEMAVLMMQKAHTAFPDNPYIELNLLKARQAGGSRSNELKPAFERLRRLPWSDMYNRQVVDDLDSLLKGL